MSDAESSNPLQNLLGDLLKMIGGTAGNVPAWWEAARNLAQGVATEGANEGNADPLERIRLSELARVAELQVGEVTGLPVSPGGRPVAFTPAGRGSWAVRTLEAWRPYLDAMVTAQEQATRQGPFGSLGGEPGELRGEGEQQGSGGQPSEGPAGGSSSGPVDPIGPADPIGPVGPGGPGGLPMDLGALFGEGGGDGLSELLARFAMTMGPVLLGLQFGSTAGHLARRATGQYAVPVPWPPSDEVLVIPQNIADFARDWSLDREETELWVCVRELAVHVVLGQPHVGARIRQLLTESTEEAVGFQQEIAERMAGEADDMDALQNLMNDPEALLADLMTPGARPSSARLTAVVTALGGYVDHVTSAVAQRVTGSGPALTEAWYRYRVADAKGEQAAASLFGIDIGREQVDRGAAFVRGVIEREGEEGLARLWESEETLPTPAEVDAPGLWLERIRLGEAG